MFFAQNTVFIEIFGYIGTALVVISMLMTSLNKLRIVNITGSIISLIYSLIISAYPIAIMNFCLIFINTFQLIKDYYKKVKNEK